MQPGEAAQALLGSVEIGSLPPVNSSLTSPQDVRKPTSEPWRAWLCFPCGILKQIAVLRKCQKYWGNPLRVLKVQYSFLDFHAQSEQ